MHPGQASMPDYIVEIDQAVVSRARVVTLRALVTSAWTGLAGGVLIVALTLATALAFRSGADFALLLMAIPGVILCADGGRRLATVRRLRKFWETAGVPPVAMRITADGLRLSLDAASDSVFLPWYAVAGFHLARWRGQRFLVLDLGPGVTATTPGVVGLDHPDIQRVLRRKVLGIKGIRFAVRTLRRPVEEIDQVLAYATNGRVRVYR
ncbi:hypothetical protein [Planosporangium mesophilum]|uniref:hypothetical protein n=1 Tax=Planosporangium mesophilum TaxID=689768 RepID=UPI00143C2F6F|nr:hypothetical protein [Planosporangium mesophilum]NJC85737.1 hypothetical protein [Planosporangium mesophilum]